MPRAHFNEPRPSVAFLHNPGVAFPSESDLAPERELPYLTAGTVFAASAALGDSTARGLGAVGRQAEDPAR